MRILFLTHRYPPDKGGVGVSARRIVAGLARWCERVDVLKTSSELSAGMVASTHLEGLTLFQMGESERGPETSQLLETTIRALHQQRDYQVVVGFYAVPTGYSAVVAARYLGLPSLVCLRGNDLERALYHPAQMSFLRWTLENATRVVGVSRELVRKARLLSGRDDVMFLGNAVDSDLFRPTSVKAEPRHLVFTGEMRLKKGSELVFPSLAHLSGDWKLTIAGGFRGRAQAEYRKWAVRNRKLAERVSLVPYSHEPGDMVELYNKADLVINPALWDGMPNSVLEAMACGRPVLATEVGGMADLIEDGKTGYLIPLSDLSELPTYVEKVLADEQRERVGQAAREHVAKEHALDVEAKAYEDVLNSLISPHSSAS